MRSSESRPAWAPGVEVEGLPLRPALVVVPGHLAFRSRLSVEGGRRAVRPGASMIVGRCSAAPPLPRHVE